MRLPGKVDDDHYVSGAPYVVTLVEWQGDEDEVRATQEHADRTYDFADLACCTGCGARINPGPVRCPLCAGTLERPAA